MDYLCLTAEIHSMALTPDGGVLEVASGISVHHSGRNTANITKPGFTVALADCPGQNVVNVQLFGASVFANVVDNRILSSLLWSQLAMLRGNREITWCKSDFMPI